MSLRSINYKGVPDIKMKKKRLTEGNSYENRFQTENKLISEDLKLIKKQKIIDSREYWRKRT